MTKILFVEPYEYYERLGLERKDCFYFGIPTFSLSLKRYLNQFDIVVTCIDHSRLSKFVVCLARSIGKKTILIMDGTYDFCNSVCHPYLKKVKRQILQYKIYDLILTPDYDFSNYLRMSASLIKYIPKHMKVIGSSYEKKTESSSILITTANTAYFNNEEFCRLTSIIKKILKELYDINVIVKLRVFDNKLLSCLYDDFPGIENLVNSDLSDVLNQIDGVISTPSSVVVSSVMANLPTCVLLYRDFPYEHPAGWVLHEGLDIKNTVRSMLSRDIHRMNYQSRMIGDQEGDLDLNSAINKSVFHFLNYESAARKIILKNSYLKSFKDFFKKM